MSIQFVAAFGEIFDTGKFKNTTLVIPTYSAGMSPHIALDLFILNENMPKAGYLKSDMMSPLVTND
jgi:predicted ATP-grasp superfamily ATP-dependent carboligase